MIILLALSQLTQRIVKLLPDLNRSSDALTFQRIVYISMLNVVVHRMNYYIKKMPAKY